MPLESPKTGLMKLGRPLNLNCRMITELSLGNTPLVHQQTKLYKPQRVRAYKKKAEGKASHAKQIHLNLPDRHPKLLFMV